MAIPALAGKWQTSRRICGGSFIWQGRQDSISLNRSPASAVVEKKIHQSGDDYQDQKEKENPPGIAPFRSDRSVADGASHAGGVLISYLGGCCIAGVGSAAGERVCGQEIC